MYIFFILRLKRYSIVESAPPRLSVVSLEQHRQLHAYRHSRIWRISISILDRDGEEGCSKG